jgi:hypothetical protein
MEKEPLRLRDAVSMDDFMACWQIFGRVVN